VLLPCLLMLLRRLQQLWTSTSVLLCHTTRQRHCCALCMLTAALVLTTVADPGLC
jgi:hypothetical protein